MQNLENIHNLAGLSNDFLVSLKSLKESFLKIVNIDTNLSPLIADCRLPKAK